MDAMLFQFKELDINVQYAKILIFVRNVSEILNIHILFLKIKNISQSPIVIDIEYGVQNIIKNLDEARSQVSSTKD